MLFQTEHFLRIRIHVITQVLLFVIVVLAIARPWGSCQIRKIEGRPIKIILVHEGFQYTELAIISNPEVILWHFT